MHTHGDTAAGSQRKTPGLLHVTHHDTPRMARHHPKLEEARKNSSLGPSKGAWPCRHLNFCISGLQNCVRIHFGCFTTEQVRDILIYFSYHLAHSDLKARWYKNACSPFPLPPPKAPFPAPTPFIPVSLQRVKCWRSAFQEQLETKCCPRLTASNERSGG